MSDYRKGCIRCEDGVGDRGGFVSHSPKPHVFEKDAPALPAQSGAMKIALGALGGTRKPTPDPDEWECGDCGAWVNGEWCTVCLPERAEVEVEGPKKCSWPGHHGDCMPKKPSLRMPEVSTKDGVVTITMQNGEYERVTYTGTLDGSNLQINSPYVAVEGPGKDVTLKLDLSSVVRTHEAMHADPHFQEVSKHGKLCVCGCKLCTLVRTGDDRSFCNCKEDGC